MGIPYDDLYREALLEKGTSTFFRPQDQVVRKPVNVNPGFNVN